ncbi:MAG: hypothetical protein AAGJ40_16025 [Planctomycetota bacterium]
MSPTSSHVLGSAVSPATSAGQDRTDLFLFIPPPIDSGPRHAGQLARAALVVGFDFELGGRLDVRWTRLCPRDASQTRRGVSSHRVAAADGQVRNGVPRDRAAFHRKCFVG